MEEKKMEIVSSNVNQAYADGLMYMRVAGVKETSRYGDVLVAPEPVTTIYTQPTKRVLFSPLRDANPFFHLMEFLWMIAGRDDVAFLQQFNSKYNFSDDGIIVPGAYGHRWRVKYGTDQIGSVVTELQRNPDSRRAMLVMADASDLTRALRGTKDQPCNTGIYFDRRGGRLNMTVLCRSNDIIWGTFGANVVHFSMLQEFVAAWIDCPVGVYRQFSNNYHYYPANFTHDLFQAAEDAKRHDYYEHFDICNPHPLVNSYISRWEDDLENFMRNPLQKGLYNDTFFSTVAAPMYWAWHVRKEKKGSGYEE